MRNRGTFSEITKHITSLPSPSLSCLEECWVLGQRLPILDSPVGSDMVWCEKVNQPNHIPFSDRIVSSGCWSREDTEKESQSWAAAWNMANKLCIRRQTRGKIELGCRLMSGHPGDRAWRLPRLLGYSGCVVFFNFCLLFYSKNICPHGTLSYSS